MNQLVLIRNHNLSNANNREIKKLFNLYEGPYKIIKVISNNALMIQDPITGTQQIINVSEVRPYHCEEQKKGERIKTLVNVDQ